MTKKQEYDLRDFDLIGFASGVYYGKLAKQLISFAQINLPDGKNIFTIYTLGGAGKNVDTELMEVAEKRHDISKLMELLMKLYLSATNLPEKEPETIGSTKSAKVDQIQITFNEQIPTFYWEEFDPFVQEEAVCSNLAEDLSEIAADLQNGMREFETGRLGNAVFEWKFGLNSHWGNHTSVIR